MDQSNFPDAAGVAGAAGAGAVAGAAVVLPERGGSAALLPAGGGSAAKACNARLRVPALKHNFKSDRCDRGVVENGFDPATIKAWAWRTAELGSVMAEIPVVILGEKIARNYSRISPVFEQRKN